MTSPAESHDSQLLRFLASAVMEDVATQEQEQELTVMLRSHQSARDEYLAFVDMHALLASECDGSPEGVDCQQSRPEGNDFRLPSEVPIGFKSVRESRPGSIAKLRRHWSGIATGGIAVCILAVSAFFALTPTEAPVVVEERSTDLSFAEIAQAVDVQWQGAALPTGSRLESQAISFRSGVLRLLFDDGVEVTLEGPADYELLGPGQTRLLSGVLAATVPEGAEGFTVDTPTAEVVDLGTSFGIDLRDRGFASVSVFEGEVEVASRQSSEKRLLTEGQSVRVGTDQEIEDADLNIARYERLWPIASGIVGSSDSFRFVPPWPRRVRFVDSDEDVFVAAEGHSVELTSELKLNISQPGEYTVAGDLTPLTLQSGTRLRSYILHYMPKSQLRVRRAQRMTGSITFDRRIVGLIVQHDELLASSRRFSRRAAGEAHQRRQLELTGQLDGDRVTLSEDRKTVSIDLVSPGRSSDLIRVIVESGGRTSRSRKRTQNRNL